MTKAHADMTFCANQQCEMKSKCLRGQPLPDTVKNLSFTLFKPNPHSKQFECTGFIRNN